MAELILKDEVYAVVGAAMDVYYTRGVGFVEPVYHAAMLIELTRRRIPFESEKELTLFYKDVRLEKKYFADLVCYDQIVIELKVVPRISNIEIAQLINYLKITKKAGWLVDQLRKQADARMETIRHLGTGTTKSHYDTRKRNTKWLLRHSE